MTNLSSINTYNFGADQAKKTNEPAKKIKSSNVAKEKGISKTAKTALVTAGVALAALGIYIFSKGKKGAAIIQNVPNNTEFTNPVEYIGGRTGIKFVLGSSNAEGTRFKPNIQGELCREFENTIIIPKTAEEQEKILREIEQEFKTLFEEQGKKLGLEKNNTTVYEMLRAANYKTTETLSGSDYQSVVETVSNGIISKRKQPAGFIMSLVMVTMITQNLE